MTEKKETASCQIQEEIQPQIQTELKEGVESKAGKNSPVSTQSLRDDVLNRSYQKIQMVSTEEDIIDNFKKVE